MGIYDILSENNLNYDQLVKIIYGLSRCVYLDAGGIVNQLDKIYDDAEYERDFGSDKLVWAVRQTQPDENLDEKTIAVFDNEEQARDLARRLNKEYGNGAIINEYGDLVAVDDWECPDLHYYDVKSFKVNPDKRLFLLD